MSDFLENENQSESNTNAEELESTIFSAPTEHKIKTPNKPKKLLPKVISAILCVAILGGGTFAVIKFIPEKETEETTSTFKEIEVVNINSDDVKSVVVNNKNGKFKLISVTEKTSSEDSSESDDTETTNWYLDGIDKSLQSTSNAEGVVSGLLSIEASREITEKSADLCGITGSGVWAEIQKNDGTTVKIIIGGDSPDGNGCYLSLSNSEKIYLVEESVKTSLDFDSLTFAATDSIPAMESFKGADDYFEDGTLTKFDTITLKGKNYPGDLKIVPNDDKAFSEYIAYKITSPEEHFADNIDTLSNLFINGVEVSGAYSYSTSESEIKKFGLDNPDLTATVNVLSRSLTYKFKLTENGDYAAWSSKGKFIYKVDASTVDSIVNGKPADFYSSLICLYPIDKLNKFTINNNGKKYAFDISSNDDEETKDDIKYIIGLGDKNIDCQSFQNLYQYIVSLSCHEFTADKLTDKPEITLEFGFSEGVVKKVEFVKVSDTKYQYSIDGLAMGKIAATKLSKLIKYTERLASGKEVGEIS